MSELVNKSFGCVSSGQSPEFYKLRFSGIKTELITNLSTDFITPINRTDIYILSDALTSQLVSVRALSELSALFWHDLRKTTGLISDVFSRQERIFEYLGNQKEYRKIAQECSDCRGISSNINFYIMRKIKDCICAIEPQPLLRYAVYVAFLELSKETEKTFSQIERILIDN